MRAYVSRTTARLGHMTVSGEPIKGSDGWWNLALPDAHADDAQTAANTVTCQTKDAQRWFDAQRVAGGRIHA
jgi:hypothetical protein